MVLLCVVGSEEEGENQFDVDGDGTRKNNLNETVVELLCRWGGERKGKSVCVTYTYCMCGMAVPAVKY